MSFQINGKNRRQMIPVIYCRGSHYDVGYDVGRTFAAGIREIVETSKLLSDHFLPVYNTPEGLEVYNTTLEVLQKSFPQYLRELQGVADGANVEFHKLLLFHLDEILPNVVGQEKSDIESTGCTTVYFNNNGEEILGHTEDCGDENLNNFYILSAHIISDSPEGRYEVKEERFTSLCYAGQLPGYTMSYNHHGLVFSINTLVAKNLNKCKTPRHFITRALLSAENFEQAIEILRDNGVGAADACSINMTFLKNPDERKFYNIEMGPALPGENESQLDIKEFKHGEYSIHCNHFLRLDVAEFNHPNMAATKYRMETAQKLSKPDSHKKVLEILGNQTDPHWIFRDKVGENNTICVGIFDLKNKTWSLYKDNPMTSEPMVVLPLLMKN